MDVRLLAGAALGLATFGALHLVPAARRLLAAAGLLVAASLVYPVACLVDREGLRTHLAFGALFLLLAWFARQHAFLLGALWVVHVVWDNVAGAQAGLVPGWYPALCKAFDIAFGVALGVFGGRWNETPPPPAA